MLGNSALRIASAAKSTKKSAFEFLYDESNDANDAKANVEFEPI